MDLKTAEKKLNREIRKRKLAEKALKESRDRFASVMNGIDAILYVADMATHRILFVNRHTRDIFGDIKGEICWQVLQAGQTGPCEFCTNKYLVVDGGKPAGPHAWEYQNTITGRWYSIRDQAIYWDGGRLARLEIATDITDLKQTEKELRRFGKAGHFNHEFLASMSHDIRTPINAVLGFTELLEGRTADEVQKRYLAGIKSSGNMLLRVIDDIIDLSKLETGGIKLETGPVNIRDVLEDVSRSFSGKAGEKGLDLKNESDPLLPEALELDEKRIRQILFNLVDNAVKYTKRGFVKVSAKPGGWDEKRGRCELILAVEDSGVGIPEDRKKAIFDISEDLNGGAGDNLRGAGLGLAITKRLAKMMDGEVSIESNAGRGSVFRVVLRKVFAASSENAPDHIGDVRPESFDFNSALILVADDVEYNRVILREHLESLNCRVLEATDGEDAVRTARNRRPDLILMDMKMPGMDGWEAAKILKEDESLKATPIIAETAFVSDEAKTRIRDSGCDDFLIKPITKKNLTIMLMKYLNCAVPKLESGGQDDTFVEPASANPDDKTRELLRLLKSRFANEWATVRRTFIMSDIGEFANRVAKLGTEYNVAPVKNWADALIAKADIFDTEGLPAMLDAFPDLIKKIENQ